MSIEAIQAVTHSVVCGLDGWRCGGCATLRWRNDETEYQCDVCDTWHLAKLMFICNTPPQHHGQWWVCERCVSWLTLRFGLSGEPVHLR